MKRVADTDIMKNSRMQEGVKLNECIAILSRSEAHKHVSVSLQIVSLLTTDLRPKQDVREVGASR